MASSLFASLHMCSQLPGISLIWTYKPEQRTKRMCKNDIYPRQGTWLWTFTDRNVLSIGKKHFTNHTFVSTDQALIYKMPISSTKKRKNLHPVIYHRLYDQPASVSEIAAHASCSSVMTESTITPSQAMS